MTASEIVVGRSPIQGERMLARQGHCVAVDLAARRRENDLVEDDEPETRYFVGRISL